MLKIKEKQLSFYSVLYEKIPENHLLKRIDRAVDFSFIIELLADSYCKDFGRPAKEPEMMMRRGSIISTTGIMIRRSGGSSMQTPLPAPGRGYLG